MELGYDPPSQQQQSRGASEGSSDLDPPTGLSPATNDEDIIVTFVRSEAPHYYQFEVSQSASEDGTYTAVRREGARETPMVFGDLEREQWYKVRGRNCLTPDRTECGQWSGWSDAVELGYDPPSQQQQSRGASGGSSDLDPPTDLSPETNDEDIIVTFERSEAPHYYQFEVSESASEDGTYTAVRREGARETPMVFGDLEREQWYKVRGRNCLTPDRTGCGQWSGWSDAVELPLYQPSEPNSQNSRNSPAPPTDLSISATNQNIWVAYTQSESPHYYEFELHRSTTESGTYSKIATDEDSVPPALFSGVSKGYWYKVRGRNCTTSSITDCGSWSGFTSVIYLEPDPPTNLSISATDDDIQVTYTRSEDPHNYEFELHRATTETGTYSRVATDEDAFSPVYFNNESKGYWYKARGRNCGASSTTSSITDCGDWSSFTSVIYLEPDEPDPPTNLSISATNQNIWVAYTQSESPHYYEFELHRSTTRTGTYSKIATDEDSVPPALFSGVSKGYWYKARGRNCTTSSRTGCGDWSSFTSVIYLEPDPPTNLSISATNDDIRVNYTRSEDPHNYEFELHRATTETGTYSRVATDEDEYSPVYFNNESKGYWHKARGRNCGAGSTTSSGIDCGSWSDFTSVIYLEPDPPTNLSISATNDDIKVTYTRSEDPHNYEFELHRATTETGTYSRVATDEDEYSPVFFNNWNRGYWYKARGRNCGAGSTSSNRIDCGDWSSFTSVIYLNPDPPTNLSISATDDDIRVNYTRSEFPHKYEFELHRSTTESGTYSDIDTDEDEYSPAYFNNVERDYWYKVRGRNCGAGSTTSTRIDCGGWSDFTSVIFVPPIISNVPPTFDEGATTTRSVPENTSSGTSIESAVSASDNDDDTLTYSLGGTDASSFSIVSTSGQLRTSASLNFETKNSYSVTVSVSDGSLRVSINVTINVTDVNEPPVFSNTAMEFDIPENIRAVADKFAEDEDSADRVTYTLSGTDNDLFSIDALGLLEFKSAPNFESPGCGTGKNFNTCKITVEATGGTAGPPDRRLSASQNLTINVIDSNEPPVFTSSDSFSPDENDTEVGIVAASDPDSADTSITYALSGTDASLFKVSNQQTDAGPTSFRNAPDFENPQGGEDDDSNAYEVTVTATGGTAGPPNRRMSEAQDLTINVTNVNEPPVISGDSFATYSENGTGFIRVYAATDPEGDTIDWSLPDTDFETDWDDFRISMNGILRFASPPDYENPQGGEDDDSNAYKVTVRASDGNLSDEIDVTIIVTNVNEPPGKPSAPTVTSSGGTRLSVTWSAPTNTGPPINDYDVQYRVSVSGPFTSATHTDAATHKIISNLDSGTSYEVQVRAKNAEGTSGWSESGTGSTDSPVVNIARQGDTVTEGDEVRFTLVAIPAPTAKLTVNISVGRSMGGDFLTGTIPSTIDITMGSTTVDLVLQTEDDTMDEADGIVVVVVQRGVGYTVGSNSSANVTVLDNDLPRPPEPAGASARSLSNESVTVGWNYRSGTKVYNVQYRKSGGVGWRTGLVNFILPDSIANLATVTGLECETRYRFQVREWGDGITYRNTWGPFTPVFSATTGTCEPVTPTPTPTPTPPTDVVYAPLVEPPGHSFLCRGFPWTPFYRETHPGQRVISPDGRHEAQVELSSTRLDIPHNSYCIEARFMSKSTPGADRIEWRGKLYKTEPFLNLEGVNPDEIGLMDVPTLLNRYEDKPLEDDTPVFSSAPTLVCETCRGGTIQSYQGIVITNFIKTPTIYAIGENTFTVEDAPVPLRSEVEWKMPVAGLICKSGFDCLVQLISTIEQELSEDIDTRLLGDLIKQIAVWFNET